jgi:hypothetical protein
MSRTPRWTTSKIDSGFAQLKLSSWKYFSDYINQEMLDYTNYVYRGHGDSKWKLEPTLDRIIKSPTSSKREDHLQRFKYETRGRRGSNPPLLNDENDWWALGQHFGLNSPLLDWTESPFVALYFAASSALTEKSNSMAVFTLYQAGVELTSSKIKDDDTVTNINDRKPTVKIIRPLSDENSRLVNQRGLFSRGPNNMDLEQWIKKFTPLTGTKFENTYFLQKIIIPSIGVRDCLRYLNRMNINHSTLFPDLTGASEYCNKNLSIKNY